MDAQQCRSVILRLIAMVLGALVSAGAATAQQTYTLRYAVDTERNINALAQTVAERQGFFSREGINLQPVRFVATGDRPTDRTALVASRDSFDMARMQLSVLMEPEGRFKGTNYVAVAAVVNNPAYFMVARPDIKTFADLKGKTLTEPSSTDPITLTARKLMEMHGLKEGDVELKIIAGSQPRVDCLKSGSCAAGSLSQPSVFAAFDAGFHTLAMHIETGPLLYVVDIVDRTWAETHSDVIVRYIRATAAAMRFIHDLRNRDEVEGRDRSYPPAGKSGARDAVLFLGPQERRAAQAGRDRHDRRQDDDRAVRPIRNLEGPAAAAGTLRRSALRAGGRHPVIPFGCYPAISRERRLRRGRWRNPIPGGAQKSGFAAIAGVVG